jgi:UDP-glucose 4-epimerase
MNESNKSGARSVLITGAEGYLGRQVVEALAAQAVGGSDGVTIVASDIRPPANPLDNVIYLTVDIRSDELARALKEHQVDTVVHLAAIVTPGPNEDREASHAVEVRGTRSILRACLASGVERFVYTSSGAAYGYYADNPEWLDEEDQIRGNAEFAYSDHKRQVEEMLARWRERSPELKQLIFRPGTILGATADNQITALFEKPFILGVAGSLSPFVFIWDQDVVGAIVKGVQEGGVGIYNLAGDGVLTMPDIAERLGKRYIAFPAWLLRGALWVLSKLGLTQYGPEQIGFLQYRPVLANRRLKEEFGYIPKKTTREVFEFFLEARGYAPLPEPEPEPEPEPVPEPTSVPTPEPNPLPTPTPTPEPTPEPAPTPPPVPPPTPEPAPERPKQEKAPEPPAPTVVDDFIAKELAASEGADQQSLAGEAEPDQPEEAGRGDDTRELLRQSSKSFRRRFDKKRKKK